VCELLSARTTTKEKGKRAGQQQQRGVTYYSLEPKKRKEKRATSSKSKMGVMFSLLFFFFFFVLRLPLMLSHGRGLVNSLPQLADSSAEPDEIFFFSVRPDIRIEKDNNKKSK